VCGGGLFVFATGAFVFKGQSSRGPASIRVLPTRAMAFLRSVALCAAVASSAAFAPAGGCCHWHAAAPRVPRAANGPAFPLSLAQLAGVHSTVKPTARTAARGQGCGLHRQWRTGESCNVLSHQQRPLHRACGCRVREGGVMRIAALDVGDLRRGLGGHGSGSCVRARYQDRPEGVVALQRSGVWRDSAS